MHRPGRIGDGRRVYAVLTEVNYQEILLGEDR